MSFAPKPYPSDVSDDEGSLVAPYLTLLPEAAGQREHALREVFNGLRHIVKTGAPWRWMPHDLPPWAAVDQQAQRWLAAGCFDQRAEDLRTLLRLAAGRKAQPSAAGLDSRSLRSSPESGERGGYDGAKRKKGSKVHMAVDTLGYLLALHVTPADADDRAEVGRLAAAAQDATGKSITPAGACPPAGQSRTGGSTRATQARSRPRLRVSTGSSRRSSSYRKPSAVSSCYLGAGWSSAASPGPPASAVPSEITSATPAPSPIYPWSRPSAS